MCLARLLRLMDLRTRYMHTHVFSTLASTSAQEAKNELYSRAARLLPLMDLRTRYTNVSCVSPYGCLFVNE